MEKRNAQRIYAKCSPIGKRQMDKWRARIAEELPDIIRRNQAVANCARIQAQRQIPTLRFHRSFFMTNLEKLRSLTFFFPRVEGDSGHGEKTQYPAANAIATTPNRQEH